MLENINLTEPITKLIECTSKGLGSAASFIMAKKNADNMAYEFKTLKESLGNEDGKISIVRNGITIESTNNVILNTIVSKEVEKIKNTLNIIENTINILSKKDRVSDEEVDEEWLNRFFQIAENITNEEMGILWGKILADEIERPNSYSIRTLEILRNLTSKEAHIFTKLIKSAISVHDKEELMIISDDEFLSKFDLSRKDFELLEELNLVKQCIFFTINKNMQFEFRYENNVLSLENKSDDFLFAIHGLTTIGKELSELINREFTNDYYKKISEFFDNKHNVKITKI